MQIPRIAGWAAAGAVLTATVLGVAASASASASASAGAAGATAPGPATARHDRDGLARRLEHGRLTVRAHGADEVVDVQRGVVTAASPTSVTVRSRDGYSQAYALTGASRLRKDRAAATPADLAVGDRVGLRAAGGAVLVLRDTGPAPARASTPGGRVTG